MITVSNPTWWDATAASSHQVSFRFELRTYDNVLLKTLVPTGASVTVDFQSAFRRTLTMSLVDDGTLIPSTSTSFLSPLSDNEIHVYYGISDGATSDEIRLGIFRISDLSIEFNDESILLKVDGVDRSYVFGDFQYTSASVIAVSTPLANPFSSSVMKSIVTILQNARNVSVPFSVDAAVSTATTPTTFVKYLGTGQTNPLTDLSDIAASIGCHAFFDVDGTLTVRQIPNMDSATPAFTFSTGGIILNASRDYSAKDFCNTIKYDGVTTSITTPLTTIYQPETSESPFNTSAIGTRALLMGSEWVFDTYQVTTAATAAYQNVRGYEVALNVIPNPRLDVMDAVRVYLPELNLNSIGLISRMTIPLDANSKMQVVVRVRGY